MKIDEIMQSLNALTVSERENMMDASRNLGAFAGEASEEVAERIITSIIKESKGQSSQVLAGICCLLQSGGTSNKVPASTKYETAGCSISMEMIRRHCRSENVTVRQLARALKTTIHDIMTLLGESAPEGNLAKTMRLEQKELSREQAIWASDFQTYNPDCDQEVSNWLKRNYRSRFRK